MRTLTAFIVTVSATTVLAGNVDTTMPAPGVDGARPCGATARIVGTVESVDVESAQLVVDGTTVQLSDESWLKAGPEPIEFEAIAVGQTVCIAGDMEGEVLVATRLTVRHPYAGDCPRGQGFGKGKGQGRGGQGAWCQERHGRGGGPQGKGMGRCGGWADGQGGQLGCRADGTGQGRGMRGKGMGRGAGRGQGRCGHGRGFGGGLGWMADTRMRAEITAIDAEAGTITLGDTVVQVLESTVIRSGPETVTVDALEVGQTVSVIGNESEAVVDALRIRVCLRPTAPVEE